MGFLGRLRVALGAIAMASGPFTRQFRTDPGGGADITVTQFGAPGDDSAPMLTDIPILVPLKRSGSGAIVGYIDPKNTPSVAPGERKLYGRNGNGAPICWLWLHDDGGVEVANTSGSLFLNADGTVTINGLVIGIDGSVTTPGAIVTTSTITGAGITDIVTDVTLGTHKHPGNNTPPTPGT